MHELNSSQKSIEICLQLEYNINIHLKAMSSSPLPPFLWEGEGGVHDWRLNFLAVLRIQIISFDYLCSLWLKIAGYGRIRKCFLLQVLKRFE